MSYDSHSSKNEDTPNENSTSFDSSDNPPNSSTANQPSTNHQELQWVNTLLQKLDSGHNAGDQELSFFDNGMRHPPIVPSTEAINQLYYQLQLQQQQQRILIQQQQYYQQQQNLMRPPIANQNSPYNYHTNDSRFGVPHQISSPMLLGQQNVQPPPDIESPYTHFNTTNNTFPDRSISDLGLRMNNFASNLGGLPSVSNLNYLDASAYQNIYHPHVAQSYSHLQNSSRSNTSIDAMKNLIESSNSSQMFQDASGTPTNNNQHPSETVFPNPETPNFNMEEYHKAPGTPISYTPPPINPDSYKEDACRKSKSKKGKKSKGSDNERESDASQSVLETSSDSFSFYSTDGLKTSITDIISTNSSSDSSTLKSSEKNASKKSTAISKSGEASAESSKTPLSPRLSYSDVLNSSQKNTNKGVNSNPSEGKENLDAHQKMNTSHNFGKKDAKKISGSSIVGSPRNKMKQLSKASDPFVSKVGLDVFNSLTEEELAATCRIQSINLEPYEYKFRERGSDVNDVNVTNFNEKFEDHNLPSSLPSSPQQSKKKNENILNNNKVTSTAKSDLKDSEFINNDLSENKSLSSNEKEVEAPEKTSDSTEEDGSNASLSESASHSKSPNSGVKSASAATLRSRNTNTSSVGGKSGRTKVPKLRRRSSSVSRSRSAEWQEQVQTILHIILTYLMLAAKWFYELVFDVVFMSSKLCVEVWRSSYQFVSVHSTVLYDYLQEIGHHYYERFMNYWIPERENKLFMLEEPKFLSESIALPQTGDEAMKRLIGNKATDCYSVLGVPPNASMDEIKRYYKKQAILVHPDKNKTPGAEEAFKILSHAFEQIGDEIMRAKYDEKIAATEFEKVYSNIVLNLMSQLSKKIQLASNMIRCTNCNGRHFRKMCKERKLYSARYCSSCNIRHAAKEGDIWSESKFRGWFVTYYSCMDGAVYDITEWARCQAKNLEHLKPNVHEVQYKISQRDKDQQKEQQMPSKRKMKELRKDSNIPLDPGVEMLNKMYPNLGQGNKSPQCSPSHTCHHHHPSSPSSDHSSTGGKRKGKSRR